MPLAVLSSPYRSALGPLFEYIGRVKSQVPHGDRHHRHPRVRPAPLCQHALHNQTAFLVKGAMLFWQGIVVVNVPFHLRS